MSIPTEFLELLRAYRKSYADAVIAFKDGRDIDGHQHIAASLKAETEILKAVFPGLPL